MERASHREGNRSHGEGSGVAICNQSWERLNRCLPQQHILLVEEIVHELLLYCRNPKNALKEDNSRVYFQKQ